jgi:hypothetical protein
MKLLLTFILLVCITKADLTKPIWNIKELGLPLVKNGLNVLDLSTIEDVFKSLTDKKVIWVIGKFKVGKSYIIDYIRNDGIVTSNSILNTIGLKIYYTEDHVLIDSEGMLQPIGENDVYLIKEFIISFMTKTADTLVYVSDQMDVGDVEQYKYFQTLFWGSKIKSMFYIHNCKTLNEKDLKSYQKRIIEFFPLHKSLFVDEVNPNKNIQHLFIPLLTTGLMTYFANFFGGRMTIDIMGAPINRRREFTIKNYLESINNAVFSIGGGGVSKIDVEHKTFEVLGSLKNDLDMIPLKTHWCIQSASSLKEIDLFVRSTKLLSTSFISANQLEICVNTISNHFNVIKTCHNVMTPVTIISPNQTEWVIQNSEFGFSVIRIPIPVGIDNPITIHCPQHTLTVQPNAKSIHVPNQTTIWIRTKEYVLSRLEGVMDDFYRELHGLFTLVHSEL